MRQKEQYIGREPQDLGPIYHWFENDGWELIADSWFEDVLAVDLNDLVEKALNDLSLVSYPDVKLEEITDELRLQHARDFIDVNYGSFPIVHIYPLNQQTDDSSVICCIASLNGHEYKPESWGVFKNTSAFIESLKTSGYEITKENNLI